MLLSMIAVSTLLQAEPLPRVLVYSRTDGFRHGSVEAGAEAIRTMGGDQFTVECTEDPSWFTPRPPEVLRRRGLQQHHPGHPRRRAAACLRGLALTAGGWPASTLRPTRNTTGPGTNISGCAYFTSHPRSSPPM